MRRGVWLAHAAVLVTLATAVAGSGWAGRAEPGGDAIAFPDGFRAWVHAKSGVIDDPAHPAFARFGGVHHIYANPLAMQGYRDGQFADGAILVFDLHTLDKKPDGSVDQGARRHVDVMVKDIERFAATGGWGYEEFVGDTRVPTLTPETRAGCAACHSTQTASDSVFSDYRQ